MVIVTFNLLLGLYEIDFLINFNFKINIDFIYCYKILKNLLVFLGQIIKLVSLTLLGFIFIKKFYPGWFFKKVSIVWKKYVFNVLKNWLYFIIYKFYYLLRFFYHTYLIVVEPKFRWFHWAYLKHNYNIMRYYKYFKLFLHTLLNFFFFLFYGKNYIKRFNFFNHNLFNFYYWFQISKISYIYCFFLTLIKNIIRPFLTFKYLLYFYILYFRKVQEFIREYLAKILGEEKKEWIVWWIYLLLDYMRFNRYLKLERRRLFINIRNFDIFWYIRKIFTFFCFRCRKRLTYFFYYYYDRGNRALKKVHLYIFRRRFIYFLLKFSFRKLRRMRILFLIHFFKFFCLLRFYRRIYPFKYKTFFNNKVYYFRYKQVFNREKHFSL